MHARRFAQASRSLPIRRARSERLIQINRKCFPRVPASSVAVTLATPKRDELSRLNEIGYVLFATRLDGFLRSPAVQRADVQRGRSAPNHLRTRGSRVQILLGAPATEPRRCAGVFVCSRAQCTFVLTAIAVTLRHIHLPVPGPGLRLARQWLGVEPVQRRNARVKVAASV